MSNIAAEWPAWRFIGAAALFTGACALTLLELRSAEPIGDEVNRFVQERFQNLDKNGDGKLTAEEVGSRRFFNRMDADGDGFVTREEAKKFFGSVANTMQ